MTESLTEFDAGNLRERVARAMCVAEGRDPDDCTFGHGWANADGSSGYECKRRLWQERRHYADAAIALIVEECAKVADDMEKEALAIMGEGCPFPDEYWPSCVAAAIRARANKEGEV